MVATTYLMTSESRGSIDKIVRDLVRVKHSRDGAILVTPVLFPSGAHVTIRVRLDDSHCLITDDGAAYAEADMMGASVIFKRVGRHVAEETRICFNSFEFFEAKASIETAAGMIAIVADAAKRAVQLTSERLARRSDENVKAIVLDRLRDVFGRDAVTPEAAISGASTHAWTVDALVKTGAGAIAVEAVSPSPVSVSAAYLKLDDIRRLDDAPRTYFAIRRKEDFATDQILILSRTAKILDTSGGRSAFERLVA